jgi:hypothetical protein
MRFWERHAIRLRVGVWITGSGKDRMVANLLNKLNKDFIGETTNYSLRALEFR